MLYYITKLYEHVQYGMTMPNSEGANKGFFTQQTMFSSFYEKTWGLPCRITQIKNYYYEIVKTFGAI